MVYPTATLGFDDLVISRDCGAQTLLLYAYLKLWQAGDYDRGPSIRRIMRETGLSMDAVYHSLDLLALNALVSVKQGVGGESNIYIVKEPRGGAWKSGGAVYDYIPVREWRDLRAARDLGRGEE